MAVRLVGEIYAISSLSPVLAEVSGCTTIFCLPKDVTPDGGIPDQTTYITLVRVPLGMSGQWLFDAYAHCHPYAIQWVTPVLEVA